MVLIRIFHIHNLSNTIGLAFEFFWGSFAYLACIPLVGSSLFWFHSSDLTSPLKAGETWNLLFSFRKWVLAISSMVTKDRRWWEPVEKEMATHSSILAWRIPWIEEPGGLQSMGSQRVRHDWVIEHTMRACPYLGSPSMLIHARLTSRKRPAW